MRITVKENNRDRKHVANDPNQEGLPKRNSARDGVGNGSTKFYQRNHGDQKSNNVVHVLSFQFILFILPYLRWNDNYFKQENFFEGMEIEGARVLKIKLGSTHDFFLKFSYMKELIL